MQGSVAHRSVSTPLRRGTAAVVIAGGALSLVGAASPAAVGPTTAPIEPVAQAAFLPVQADPGQLLRSAIEPVTPEPEVMDAGELVKAVEQEIARAAAAQAAAQAAAEAKAEQDKAAARAAVAVEEAQTRVVSAGSADCGISTSGLGAVRSHVRSAAEFLGCLFGEPTLIGVAGRSGTSDHPAGLATDFMVDRATGDALAACALRNQGALGIKYVIWEQRINHGNGWEPMEDRGGVTANHFDHVHISYNSGAGSGGASC